MYQQPRTCVKTGDGRAVCQRRGHPAGGPSTEVPVTGPSLQPGLRKACVSELAAGGPTTLPGELGDSSHVSLLPGGWEAQATSRLLTELQ